MSGTVMYYSTNGKAERVRFGEALLKGLAPDKGLYMPDHIPELDKKALKNLVGGPYHDVAFTVVRNFLHEDIPDGDLMKLVKDAYNFPVPLEQVYERKYILRLDQGPTASFKDFAARLMGRLMQYFLGRENRRMLILTATSGDTGSAIANAFYDLENIRVMILYPDDEVTPRQRKQMTTLRKNISVLALKGKFDDCQALVKRAFSDKKLEYMNLSSANSINIGRLIPQSVYYFYSWLQLIQGGLDEPVIFSIPSGNFGNMMGGLLAREMGLPVKRFVIATNENDEVPIYWQTGNYNVLVPSRNCISSAMNVGHPSNLARVVALYGGMMDEKGIIVKSPDVRRMHQDITALSITDKQTVDTIKDIYSSYCILTEPHGAASWAGLMRYFTTHPQDAHSEQLAIVLETAHPAKFPEAIISALGFDPELPPALEGLEELAESFDTLENDYTHFRDYLIDRY